MTELDDEVDKELEPDRPRPRPRPSRTLYVQMCYPGQNFDMSVPVPEGTALDEPGLLDLAERFHDQHEAERGFCFRIQQPRRARRARHRPRLHARSPTTSPRPAPSPTRRRRRKGTRRAYWGDECVDTPVYDGAAARRRRATIDGPALIEEPFTVVVLPPGTTADARRPRQLRHHGRLIRPYAWSSSRSSSGVAPS